MAGGEQINSGQGTLTYQEGWPLAGEATASAAGTATLNRLIPLRSKKPGSGTSSQALSGAVGALAQGAVGWSKAPTLQGQAVTLAQGTLTYGGLATLSWNANTEPDLAGYYVYHGTTPNPSERVRLGVVTSYQWGGLTGGQTHYFAVTAYDTSGNESEKSAEVSKAY